MGRPNILIFMTDHQRGDTVLPEHPARTPNLDGFLAEGVAFTNAFTMTPHCCPSRASFLSGLYPSQHGVWNNVLNDQALRRGLKPGVRLWSEDLAEAGYHMLYAGKWHVSATEWPRDRGWEELTIGSTPRNRHAPDWDYYRRLAEEPEKAERGEGEILRPGYGTYQLYGSGPDAPHDERYVEDAVDALRDLTHGDQPWCLFVGPDAPHDPYFPPRRFLEPYDLDDVPLSASFADRMQDKPVVYQRMRQQVFGQLSKREVREAIRHYWALCSYLDHLFGRLLAALDEGGQARETLVVYCADHADYCGDHGLFAKGIPCFRGAYHVPMAMRWPDGIQRPGRRVEEFISHVDIAPTFLEVAGLSADRFFAGRSLAPFLCGQVPDGWRDELHTQCNGIELYFTQRSVMTRDYKYVFNGFDRDELYDLRRDPHEMANLAADPAHAEVKREMCRRMWRFARRQEDGVISDYITVGLAPHGPAEAFGGAEE
ncbi:MAG: sulfatase-like hydrolase/transferase [Planctomycetota bacterium]|jgi:arylsulfatase A-like enzyme